MIEWRKDGKKKHSLLPNLHTTNPQRPHHALYISQSIQDIRPILREILMDDNLDLTVSLGLRDGSAREDADLGYGRRGEHCLQDGGPDEPCCAGEEEMHRIVPCSFRFRLWVWREEREMGEDWIWAWGEEKWERGKWEGGGRYISLPLALPSQPTYLPACLPACLDLELQEMEARKRI